MEIKYRTEFGELLKHLGLEGPAVEIGVAEGRNAESIASWSSVTTLYLIDSWTHLNQKGDGFQPQDWHDFNLSETKRRMQPFSNKAIYLRGLSLDMVRAIEDDSLIFAYLDGDHSYNGFTGDLSAIYSKVKSGGVIAGHDYLNPAYGVNSGLHDFIQDSQYDEDDIHQTEEDGDESMVSFWFIKK
jgi:methyltransferase family protein